MFLRTCAGSVAVMAMVVAHGVSAQEHAHGPAAEKLGTVAFATSCSASAQPQFNHAVALLHSFEFLRAIDGFGATLATDPSCAMAEWGIALSRWGNPMPPSRRRDPSRASRRSRRWPAGTRRN